MFLNKTKRSIQLIFLYALDLIISGSKLTSNRFTYSCWIMQYENYILKYNKLHNVFEQDQTLHPAILIYFK